MVGFQLFGKRNLIASLLTQLEVTKKYKNIKKVFTL